MSAQEYAHNLEDNIKHLVERLKSTSDRAQLVRQHSMPQGGGKGRPLGMPVVEDKLVQRAVTRLLTAIDEQDVLRWSSGYRPHVGALDAVDALTITRQCGRYHWVVDADITGFFDNIDQEGIRRMVAERLDDRARIRLIKKWRKAGVLDTDGTVRHPATGSSQGGVVSPILANVSLHYARDRWVEQVVKRHCHGEACLIRSADDDVCACEQREDAERCYTVLGQRLWCKEHRHLRLRVLFERLHSKLRGYDNDDGVHGHTASLQQCFHRAIRLLMQWLNRRRQRRGYNGHGYTEVRKHFKVERPRIVGRPRPKKAVLMAEANMRQRVWLKSPVRENRTPGSVRGRSGNWPSYCDDFRFADHQGIV